MDWSAMTFDSKGVNNRIFQQFTFETERLDDRCLESQFADLQATLCCTQNAYAPWRRSKRWKRSATADAGLIGAGGESWHRRRVGQCGGD